MYKRQDAVHFTAEDAVARMPHEGDARGDMSLCRCISGQTVFFNECVQLFAFDIAASDCQRADHFQVCRRHVTGARRFRDIGVLHFG